MELTSIDGTQLQLTDAMLEHCAEAMYKIREPKGSTRVPFHRLSGGKKLTNRRVEGSPPDGNARLVEVFSQIGPGSSIRFSRRRSVQENGSQ